MQAQPEHAGGERRDQLHGRKLDEPEVGGERGAEPERRVQVAEVVPDDQLHDEGHRAEEPHVQPRGAAQQRRLRQPGEGDEGAEQEADGRREPGEQQGQPDALQHGRREEVVREDIPLVVLVGHERPHGLGEREHDDRGERPAEPVLQAHDRQSADVNGGCRGGGCRRARCGGRGLGSPARQGVGHGCSSSQEVWAAVCADCPKVEMRTGRGKPRSSRRVMRRSAASQTATGRPRAGSSGPRAPSL